MTTCGCPSADGGDVRALAEGADDVHRLVLLAGREAVDDVGGRQRLAVRPLDALADLERQRLAVLAPRVALGEPLVLAAAAGGRRDHERLVDATAHERRRRQSLDVRVEVAHERRIARARRDEALVRGRGRARRRGARRRRLRARRRRVAAIDGEAPAAGSLERTDSSCSLPFSPLCGADSPRTVGVVVDLRSAVGRGCPFLQLFRERLTDCEQQGQRLGQTSLGLDMRRNRRVH